MKNLLQAEAKRFLLSKKNWGLLLLGVVALFIVAIILSTTTNKFRIQVQDNELVKQSILFEIEEREADLKDGLTALSLKEIEHEKMAIEKLKYLAEAGVTLNDFVPEKSILSLVGMFYFFEALICCGIAVALAIIFWDIHTKTVFHLASFQNVKRSNFFISKNLLGICSVLAFSILFIIIEVFITSLADGNNVIVENYFEIKFYTISSLEKLSAQAVSLMIVSLFIYSLTIITDTCVRNLKLTITIIASIVITIWLISNQLKPISIKTNLFAPIWGLLEMANYGWTKALGIALAVHFVLALFLYYLAYCRFKRIDF